MSASVVRQRPACLPPVARNNNYGVGRDPRSDRRKNSLLWPLCKKVYGGPTSESQNLKVHAEENYDSALREGFSGTLRHH